MKQERKDKFLDNYRKSWCNIAVSCDATGISRQTFYNWKADDEKFAEAVWEVEERNLDLAETKLLAGIQEGKTAELLFYLKTKGKSRGYVERQEIEMAEKRPLSWFDDDSSNVS